MTTKPKLNKESMEKEIKIERVWAMPNKWTFALKPIKKLLDEEIINGFGVGNAWADPFAGKYGSKYVL
jgi:hypothetical protein